MNPISVRRRTGVRRANQGQVSMWSSLVVWAALPLLAASNYKSRDEEELLNWCIKSDHHKARPGPESNLYKQCQPWKNRSCCTEELTRDIHHDNPYNFNMNHCPGKTLSDKCRKRFIQDHCFYECSPNIGPWVVAENRSWRKERYYKVPLCASDCDVWFDSCAEDYTCTNNWARNFEWKTSENGTGKTNFCPKDSSCDTFKSVFKDAKTFCETVWDGSWLYTNDSYPCMRLWFSESGKNPNDKVAQMAARMLAKAKLNGAPGWSDGRLTLVLSAGLILAMQMLMTVL
ncbi:folate receptor gamma-like isoform X2 [Eriocheir sinensis]|uniref:folate receptor gamma-like isoform X2 n=1 Tax=Eriocheir sinensis TaxID=95602 RepID=UPI0021C668D0|nr:folate receptor gamma-like isoform X2 [Eriocheir sinensis]